MRHLHGTKAERLLRPAFLDRQGEWFSLGRYGTTLSRVVLCPYRPISGMGMATALPMLPRSRSLLSWSIYDVIECNG